MYSDSVHGQTAGSTPPQEEMTVPQVAIPVLRAPTSGRLPQPVDELVQRLLQLRQHRQDRAGVEARYLSLMEAMRNARDKAEWQNLSNDAFAVQQQLRDFDQSALLIKEDLRLLEQYFLA